MHVDGNERGCSLAGCCGGVEVGLQRDEANDGRVIDVVGIEYSRSPCADGVGFTYFSEALGEELILSDAAGLEQALLGLLLISPGLVEVPLQGVEFRFGLGMRLHSRIAFFQQLREMHTLCLQLMLILGQPLDAEPSTGLSIKYMLQG